MDIQIDLFEAIHKERGKKGVYQLIPKLNAFLILKVDVVLLFQMGKKSLQAIGVICLIFHLSVSSQRVFVWDLDETIIIFHSLLTGTFASRYGKVLFNSFGFFFPLHFCFSTQNSLGIVRVAHTAGFQTDVVHFLQNIFNITKCNGISLKHVKT